MKMLSISVFLNIIKFADFRSKNCDASRTQEVGHVVYIFLDLLLVRYHSIKFHQCRVCLTDYRDMGPFYRHPSIREQPQKGQFCIGLNKRKGYFS